MLGLTLARCLFAIFLCCGVSLAVRAESRPNIVLIYADDMAYGDLSANNAGAWVQTPNLDALAADGMRFTNGYSAAPVCGPSRVALMTGAYPQRFGTWWNPDTSKTKLPASQTLLPALLRDAGYVSAVIGKWNLPTDPKDAVTIVKDPMIWGGGYWPEEDGSYVGVGKGTGADSRMSGLWGPQKTGDEYLTDRLTGHAVDIINSKPDKPFFIYLAYNAPHSPLEAHQRFRDRVAHLKTEPQRLYAAMVLAIDDGVGKVRAALRANGMEKNTIVVFASDNGPAKGDFKTYLPEWPKNIVLGSTGKFSGTKGTYREGGIREPFLFAWPASVKAGQVDDDPVMTIDLYRTFAEVAGATVPDTVLSDGRSILPLVRDKAKTLPERDLYWAGRICKDGTCKDSGALRNGAWKLLIENGGAPQLFDLSKDEGEKTNLASKEGARLGIMLARYQQWKGSLPENASGTAGKPGGKKKGQKGDRQKRGKKPGKDRNS